MEEHLYLHRLLALSRPTFAAVYIEFKVLFHNWLIHSSLALDSKAHLAAGNALDPETASCDVTRDKSAVVRQCQLLVSGPITSNFKLHIVLPMMPKTQSKRTSVFCAVKPAITSILVSRPGPCVSRLLAAVQKTVIAVLRLGHPLVVRTMSSSGSVEPSSLAAICDALRATPSSALRYTVHPDDCVATLKRIHVLDSSDERWHAAFAKR